MMEIMCAQASQNSLMVLSEALMSPSDPEGQRNNGGSSIGCEHVVVATLDEEFDVRRERDSTAKVIPALVYAEIAGDCLARCADTNAPEFVADGNRNYTSRGQQHLAIVKAVTSGRVRTELFLLNKFVNRVRRQTPYSQHGAL